MQTDLKTILVIEDDPNDQLLIKSAFESFGVTTPIQTVSCGKQAVEYMSGEGDYATRRRFAFPAFIITDLKMSPGDGFMVLDELRKNPKWRLVPAIVLSSSEDPDDIKQSYLLGAASYHVKPPSLKELRQELKILYDYWRSSRFPIMDEEGNLLPTESRGKLGDRFSKEDHLTKDGKATHGE